MQLAVINERECIGCSKCIPVCPVDAIVGAPQFMHKILAAECIGCGLCLPPCPVDCIELQETAIPDQSAEKRARAQRAKERYQRRQERLALLPTLSLMPPLDPEKREQMRAEIKAAIERVQAKRDRFSGK